MGSSVSSISDGIPFDSNSYQTTKGAWRLSTPLFMPMTDLFAEKAR
jgi:hypothetical protein